MNAGKLIQDLFKFKKKNKRKNNINQILTIKKRELNKLYNVKLEYLELRNINNFKLSNNFKNSKIFVAFYSGRIRLIDNI